MLIYIYVSIFLSLSGMIMFSLNRKHLLVMLLSLEFIMVSLYFNILIYLSELNYEFFFSMIFLTMSVCEGALGLAILVLMIRVHGNDYILSFSTLW
uniref:NADH-ubiquinone oxidoreductase chain 4L n=1 Tax=Monochamus sparsutus TaxID=1191621 RepID=A0A7S7BHD1_9CUCU|nr:NADH dehydrogenase subunit 4L [Monochamus sparsutus]QOW83760.1 NADH dehydrogenase subunit 4L [Monochamus sparsutus]